MQRTPVDVRLHASRQCAAPDTALVRWLGYVIEPRIDELSTANKRATANKLVTGDRRHSN